MAVDNDDDDEGDGDECNQLLAHGEHIVAIPKQLTSSVSNRMPNTAQI